MKRLFVLMLVVSVAGAASGALKISVDGVVDPPDTEINLLQNDTLVLGIWGDGGTSGPESAWLFVQGPGSVECLEEGLIIYADPGYGCLDCGLELGIECGELLEMMSEATGLADIVDLVYIVLGRATIPPPPLEGMLVDGIGFTCTDLGDVILTLISANDFSSGVVTVLDTQVIHQIPEPMSLALLGLGAIFIHRYRER